jgi:capsular polysaccharide biosynthesis protein
MLSGLSVQEQINLFSYSTIIIAPHGAGLTNMIWSKKGVYFIPNYLIFFDKFLLVIKDGISSDVK